MSFDSRAAQAGQATHSHKRTRAGQAAAAAPAGEPAAALTAQGALRQGPLVDEEGTVATGGGAVAREATIGFVLAVSGSTSAISLRGFDDPDLLGPVEAALFDDGLLHAVEEVCSVAPAPAPGGTAVSTGRGRPRSRRGTGTRTAVSAFRGRTPSAAAGALFASPSVPYRYLDGHSGYGTRRR